VKFSLWPNARFPASDILAEAQEADEQGWYGVWLADHYMPNTGDETVADGPMHEVWGLLPAVAATTKRVRVGTLVSPTSVHHPALLANRAATVDHVSHGRMVLGIGAGWQLNEHAAYGIELEPPGRRVARFEESIRIIRSLLDEQRTTLQGTIYEVTDAPCDPKPVQERLPILVGSKGPRMLRSVVRYADEWNVWGDPEVAAGHRQRLLEACDESGRDPATFHCSAQALVFLDRAPEGARMPAIAGSATELVDTLGRYAEAGFDEFILPDSSLGTTLEERRDRIGRIKAEVFDQLA